MQTTFLKGQQTMAQKVKCNLCSCISFTIALLLLSVTVESQPFIDPTPTLRSLFEGALLNNSENIYGLQQIYFNPSPVYSQTPICLRVFVSVDNINELWQDGLCYYDGDHYNDYSENENSVSAFHYGCRPSINSDCTSDSEHIWSFTSVYELKLASRDDEDGTSQLSDLLTTSGSTSMFYAFDSTFYNIMKALSVSTELSFSDSSLDFSYSSTGSKHADIGIHISQDLQDMPCWSEVDYELRMVLVWAKAYARPPGLRSINLDVDQSTVSKGVNTTDPGSLFNEESFTCPQQHTLSTSLIDSRNAWVLFLSIFILSNLLFLSSVIRYFRKMFLLLQQQNKFTKTLYKASAIVLTCVNITVLISDTVLAFRDLGSGDDILFNIVLWIMAPVKLPLVLFILIIETPLICCNTTYGVNNKRHRVAHAFALCQIIWFGHRLVTDAIISIVFFVIAPAQTLGIVTLLLSVIASAIAFVAIILYEDFTGCNKKTLNFLFCASFNGIMICCLFFLITLLFIVFVDNGLKSAGMGGLILSLVPAFAGAVFGLYVNQKYFRSTTSTASANTTTTITTEPQETQQTTAIQIVNETETYPLLRRPQT